MAGTQAGLTTPDASALYIARAQWLVSKLPMIYLGNAASAAGLVLGLWFIQGSASLALWAALALGHILLCRSLTWAPSQAEINDYRTARNWARYVGFSCLLQGVIWGAAAPLFLVTTSPPHIAVVMLILAGVVIGGVPLMSSHPRAFALFAIPATLPAAYVFATSGPDFLLMTGIAIAFLCISILMALDNHRTIAGAVQLSLEKEHLVGELEHQVQRAETALQEKSHFFAAASHDLRQPLTALNLFADELTQTDNNGELNPAPVHRIRDSLHTLNDMFDSLLDLSRLDAGAVQINPAPTALAPLMQQLAAQFLPQATARGLELRVVISSLAVQTDPTHLQRILSNLLSNAIRHTHSGKVLLGCRRSGTHVRIEVWDTGPGIPANEHAAIFNEFHQLTPAQSPQGKGLGLAIVKRLAQLLDAPVNLLSEPGKGSCFAITLPRSAAPGPAGTLPENQPLNLSNITALVVDNDPAVLDALSRQLTHWECRVMAAGNSQSALCQIEEIEPDIIISDYRLDGDETGLQLIHNVRAQLKRAIPAAIISGDSLASEKQLRDRGVTFPVLAKPLRPARLRLLLARLLESNNN